MTYEIALVTIAAFVLAGVSWNTLGIWQKWRDAASDSKIDLVRVRKNVIIGAVLGIIAYGVQVGTAVPDAAVQLVNTIPEFAGMVMAAFPLIVVADKIFNRKKN